MQSKVTIKNLTNNEYIFSVIAKFIGIFTGIIYTILFSRYFGAELRGQSSVILNYGEMISLVLCLGVYQAYPYFKKEFKKDIYIEYINYIFGLLVLYIIIACILILNIDFDITTKISIILAPILMGIKQLNYVVLIENSKLRNTSNIKLDIFDIVLLAVLMVFTKANLVLCILFLIVKHLVFLFIAISNLQIKISDIRPTLKGIMPYIKYGIVPMLTVILMEINYKVDIIMLDRFYVSTTDIGIYSLGVMLAQKIWIITDALKDILLSKLAKGRTVDEVSKVTRISLFITILIIIGVICFGKPFIVLLYGKEYSGSYLVTLIIMAGVVGMVFYKMVYSYNVVNGHKNINLILLGIAALLNIIVNIVAIPHLGSLGAALASLVSYSICGIAFLMYFCIKTQTPIRNMLLINKNDIKMIKLFFYK
ncbi:MAG: lipopolysaccharide biosynthesis protein [Clostridium sp.]